MRQTGKVFSLLHPGEEEEHIDLKIQGVRIRFLIETLKSEGYRVDSFPGNKFKYSILERQEDGFEEVGIIASDEVHTRDSTNLERFLESYKL